MSTPQHERSFTVNVVGETTGQTWYGSFTAKTRLTYRDRLVRDARRRDLLGGIASQQQPSGEASDLSFILADLIVRLTKAPVWWTGAQDGLDLEDLNVVAAVYAETTRIEREALEALRKQGEEARADIAKDVPPPRAPETPVAAQPLLVP